MDFFFHDTYFVVSVRTLLIAATIIVGIIVTPIFLLLLRSNRRGRED